MSAERPGYVGEMRDLGNETKQPREMSRVFIYQSKSTDQIRQEMLSGKKPEDLSFVNLIFAEKSADSISPNQLLPVGGSKRPDDKDSLGVARRRMLEETHLRPVRIKKLGNTKYDLKDPRHENSENISATYFLAEVLPLDVAYSLNPQEDKISGYHQVDLSTYQNEILKKGYLLADAGKETERKLPLIDSLRVTNKQEGGGVSSSIVENVSLEDVFEIQGKLVEELEKKDFDKSQKILKHLVSLLDLDDNAVEYWQLEIEESKELADSVRILKELLDYASKFIYQGDSSKVNELFLAAYDLSNFEDEVSEHRAGRSHNEMVLRTVFSLLESKYKYDHYLEIVKANPDLADFASRLEKFIKALSSNENEKDGRQNLFFKLKGLDEVDSDLVEEEFFNAFFDFKPNTPEEQKQFKQKIIKTLAAVDSLLDEKIVRSKLAPLVREQYNERLLTQMGEIRNASIYTLMKYALPGAGLKEKKRFKQGAVDDSGKGTLKRVVFEARRKLAMLFLLLETDAYYDEVLHAGVQEIQEVWNDLIDPPKVSCFLSEKRDANGELLDINVEFDDPKDDRSQKTAVRPFRDKNGEATMLIGQSLRLKERESMYRKMIVRGYDSPSDVKDIYGRSLVIMPAKNSESKNILEKEERVLEVCDKDQQGNMVCEDKSFVDHKAVLDIIEGLQKNKYIKILEYKPTNEPGTAFKSSGAGGEAPIRLAKFYIQHTSLKGVVRTEEVQIFTPSLDGHSGFYWEKKKKEDDENYEFERLLRTKGIHSFIEILYPALIYGKPIQNINKKNIRIKKRP